MSDVMTFMQQVRERTKNPFMSLDEAKRYINYGTKTFDQKSYKQQNQTEYFLNSVRYKYGDYTLQLDDIDGFINRDAKKFDSSLFEWTRDFGKGYNQLGLNYTQSLNMLMRFGAINKEQYEEKNPYYSIENKTPKEFTFDVSGYKYDENDPIDVIRQARGIPPKSLLEQYDFTDNDDVKLYEEGKKPRSMGGMLKTDSAIDKLGDISIEIPEDQAKLNPEETQQQKNDMNKYFMSKYGYETASATPMVMGESQVMPENFWTKAYQAIQGAKEGVAGKAIKGITQAYNPMYGLFRTIVDIDNRTRKDNKKVGDSFTDYIAWLTNPINQVLTLPFTMGAKGDIAQSKVEKGKVGAYLKGMGQGIADTFTKNDVYDTRRMFEEVWMPNAMNRLKQKHPGIYNIVAGVMQYIGPEDLLPGIGFADDIADAAKVTKGIIRNADDMMDLYRINRRALASLDDVSKYTSLVKNADDPAAALAKIEPETAEKVINKLEGEKITEALDETVPEWRSEVVTTMNDGVQQPYTEINGVKYYDEAVGQMEDSALATRAQNFERVPEEAATKLAEEPVQYQRSLQDVAEINAQKVMEENDFEILRRNVLEGDSFTNATEATVARNVFDELLNKGRTDEALEILDAASRKFTKAGQIGNAAKWWNAGPTGVLKMAENILKKNGQKLTPELTEILTRAASELDAAKQAQNVDGYIDAIKNLADNRGVKITARDEKFMRTLDVNELDEIASAQLAAKVYDVLPSSVAKKISTYQAISHLLNLRTLARNAISNSAFNLVERVSNLFAAPFDWAMSVFTGRRTIGLKGNILDQMKAGAARGRTAMLNTKVGTFNLVGSGKYELFQNRTFNKGLSKKLEDAMGYGLRVPDEYFKGLRTEQVKQSMTYALGYKNWDDVPIAEQRQISQIANQEALYATFQDNTWAGTALQWLKEGLNRFIGVGPKVPGQIMKQTRAFGAGDLLVKYTRVPGALMTRSLEYSPAGALKAVYNVFKSKGISKQRNIAQALGRASVGSLGLYGVGKLLHNKGLIKSSNDETNKDIKNIQKQQGMPENSINISAVERWIKGEDLEAKTGDKFVSLGSIEIFGQVLAIGAEVDRIMKIDDPEYGFGEKAIDIAEVSLDTLLDMPMMYVLSKMQTEIQKKNNDDPNAMPFPFITVPLAESLPGFVWSGARQIAQTIDPVYRETYGDTWQQQAMNKIINNIPVMREELRPQRDVFGEQRINEKEMYKRFIDLAVNPMYVSDYKKDEITSFVLDLSKRMEDESFIPRTVPVSKVEWKEATFKLSQAERNRYQHIEGNVLNQYYAAIYDQKDTFTDEELVEVFTSSRKKAELTAKAQIAIEKYERGEMDYVAEVKTEGGEIIQVDMQTLYDEYKNVDYFKEASQIDKIEYLSEYLDYLKGE